MCLLVPSPYEGVEEDFNNLPGDEDDDDEEECNYFAATSENDKGNIC